MNLNLPAVLKRNDAAGLKHRLDALEQRRAAAQTVLDEKVAARNGVIEDAVNGDPDARKRALKLKGEVNRLTSDRNDLDTAIIGVKRRHDEAAGRERLDENLAVVSQLRALLEKRLDLAKVIDSEFESLGTRLKTMRALGEEIDALTRQLQRMSAVDRVISLVGRREYVRDRLALVVNQVGLWPWLRAAQWEDGQAPRAARQSWLRDSEAAAAKALNLDAAEERIKTDHGT